MSDRIIDAMISMGRATAGETGRWLARAFHSLLLVLLCTTSVDAAELNSVAMPDTQDAAGTHLVLNGAALRTYSILRIHIYGAGLYLERRSTNADAIIDSSQTKLLRFVFIRHVDAEDARKSWRESLERNCRLPCHLSADSIDRFLAGVPSVENGDTSSLLFTAQEVDAFMNGQLIGRIRDTSFARVMLMTFIGPDPVSTALKNGLLNAPQ